MATELNDDLQDEWDLSENVTRTAKVVHDVAAVLTGLTVLIAVGSALYFAFGTDASGRLYWALSSVVGALPAVALWQAVSLVAQKAMMEAKGVQNRILDENSSG